VSAITDERIADNRLRFMAKIAKSPGGCIEWCGFLTADGYGRLRFAGSKQLAHRVAWFLATGSFPLRALDHLCRNRRCVNVDHLQEVSLRENILRGQGLAAINARKTECVHGHPLSADNMFVDSLGRRVCRACRRRIENARCRRLPAAAEFSGKGRQ